MLTPLIYSEGSGGDILRVAVNQVVFNKVTDDLLARRIYHDVPYEQQFVPEAITVSKELKNFQELIAKERLQLLSRQVHSVHMRNKHTLMQAMAQALSEASRTAVDETGHTEYDAALEAVQRIIQGEVMYVFKDEVLRGVQQEEWKIRKQMKEAK